MKSIGIAALCLALLVLSGCGGGEKKAGMTVSPEMKEFIAGFGSHQKVAAQLKKFGAEGLDTKDMGIYDLKDPAVVSVKSEGAATCYVISTKAGITTRFWTVCWEGGKVVSVTDHQFVLPQ